MANANPSGLGYTVPAGGARPELNLLENEKVVRKADGKVVIQRTMTNGNILESQVFPGDYPEAEDERDNAPAKAEPKAKK